MARGVPTPASHIMTFAQTFRGGGVERAMLRLAAGWIAAGRRVTMLAGNMTGPLASEIPAGMEVISLGSGHYIDLRPLPRYVHALRPDVLFCPGNHYSSMAGWTRLKLGKATPPIVGKVSNALLRPDQRFPIRQAYPFWLRLNPLFFDHAVAMSEGMRTEVIARMGMPAERTSVIANPPARPIPGAMPVTLPEGRFLLGVGRLVRQKRWDRLIAALPHIDPNVRLIILGEGEERGRLEAQAAALGLADRLWMPGNAADPLPAIAHAKAVILTSDFEGVPGVLREALALGTPVVATDSSVAVREIITSPEQGEVVPIGDAAALVAALQRRLAATTRPAPVPDPGEHASAEYLALFDRIVAQRKR